MVETYVVVGASLAGGTAAATLRKEGFDGRIVLVGKEAHPPYERPPLSKEYLRGETEFKKALVHPLDFYETNEIETRFETAATKLDALGRIVETADGEGLPFDKLLIATGSRNRRLPIPGLELEGVLDLRTKEDCDQIRARIQTGSKAVIVGMGFIGAEVAASLRRKGVEVAVVEVFKVPLQKALGEQVGGVFESIHRDEGVEMHFEESVSSFRGGRRVEAVVTKSGMTIECDFAVVGVGIEPVTEWVQEAGIEIDNGIVVDEHCRTNVEDVFAAGDVTNHYHPVFEKRMRVEHWNNAIKQGTSAAKNMLGKSEPYDETHWFWSDQYDYNLQYAGDADGADEMVLRGSLEERNFCIFHLKEGRLVAAVALGRGKLARQSMKLIKERKTVDPSKLADDAVDLKSL